MRREMAIASFALALMGCWEPKPPEQAGLFRFAVFGDGPYHRREMGRFNRVLDALDRRDLAFVVHVGDILWYPCSDDAFRNRLDAMNRLRHPVVYTPGDNEWSDCHERIAGGYEPLGRLESLRRIFFATPERSLGGRAMDLATQSVDSSFAEFVEHARWVHQQIVFTTLHVVGGANGGMPFPGRTAAHDAEVRRRSSAAIEWLRDAFAVASDIEARGVVLAWHANTFFDDPAWERAVYDSFLETLTTEAVAFGRYVLIVHGDWHEYTVDRPLPRAPNVQRLQTFGSPDIGWVDVVVDTTSATLFRFEANLTPRWMWW